MTSTRKCCLCLLLCLSVGCFGQARPNAAEYPSTPSTAERELLQLANASRAQERLPPLVWDPALARAARLHAARMLAEPGELEHQYSGEPDMVARATYSGAHFESVSENLARRARSVPELHRLWMSTAIHRGNLLDPGNNAVGISVLSVDGLLFAVEDFAHSVPNRDAAGLEKAVASALLARGLDNAVPSASVRELCVGAPRSLETAPLPDGLLATVQWTGANPAVLPTALLKQLKERPVHRAELGACPNDAGHGVSTWRVVALLF